MSDPESRQDTVFPPASICVAAGICIVLGMNGLAAMITPPFEELIRLEVLGLFLGKGLLAGSQKSRKWALIFGSIYVALIAIGGILSSIEPLSREKPTWQINDWIWLTDILISLALAGFLVWSLTRPKGKAWFNRPATAPTPTWVNRVTLLGAICSLIPFLALAKARNDHKTTLTSLFPFDCRVDAVNAMTGESLKSLGFRSPKNSSNASEPLPTFHSSSSSYEGKTGFQFTGIADKPLELTIISDGYQPQQFVIQKGTASKTTMRLVPELPVLPRTTPKR